MTSVPQHPLEKQETSASGFDTFLQWELSSRQSIDVKVAYIDMAGDIVAGVLLSQIVYWHLPDRQGRRKLRVARDGKLWLVKSRHDWWSECRLSPKQVDRAIKLLAAKGLIETRLYSFGGVPKTHIRIVQDAFLATFQAQINAPETATIFPKGKYAYSPKGEKHIPQRVISYTETTTENTTERGEGDAVVEASAVAVVPPPPAKTKAKAEAVSPPLEGKQQQPDVSDTDTVDVPRTARAPRQFPEFGPRAAQNPALKAERSFQRQHELYDAYATQFDAPPPPPNKRDLDAAWWAADNGYTRAHIARATAQRLKDGHGSSAFRFVIADLHELLRRAGPVVELARPADEADAPAPDAPPPAIETPRMTKAEVLAIIDAAQERAKSA